MKKRFTYKELNLFNKILIVFEKIEKNQLLYAEIEKFNDTLVELMDKYPNICIITDKNGRNIGTYATFYSLEKAVFKALDNKEASIQQDKMGYNIGMHAKNSGLKKAVLKAEQSSTQEEKDSSAEKTLDTLSR